MLSFIRGQITAQLDEKVLITNDLLGIEAFFTGPPDTTEFFLAATRDDQRHSTNFFAFTDLSHKKSFEKFYKISGVGPKIARALAQSAPDEIRAAVRDLDHKFFQKVPGIGPKLAKKLLISLAETLDDTAVRKLQKPSDLDAELIASLAKLGYDRAKIRATLEQFPGTKTPENRQEILTRALKKL